MFTQPDAACPASSLPLLLVGLCLCAHVSAAAPDYARLSLKGNGHAQDHFSLAVQAAARVLGRNLDYETLYVLSTNAFAPCVDPAENCTAWWMTATGRDTSADLIGRCLGLRFRRITGPSDVGAPPMPPDGPARAAWFGEYLRRPAVAAIRQAQSDGEVVLTDREWPGEGPHGYYPWCWWGVIVEARDDGTVLGAGLNGFTDNPLEAVGGMLAVRLTEPGITRHEADFEVLCRAVSRIHGSDAPFLPGDRTVYGLDAVNRWIGRMEQVPFCEACGDQSVGCAYDTARPTYEGAKVAARFLRGCAGGFPVASQPHLLAAAQSYERIAALLAPALASDGAGSYRDIIGDRAKQESHVTSVLRPLRTQLRRAADEMGRALVASLPPAAAVRGVPAGKGDGNAFARGLEVLLTHLGTPADYDTLMGDLGLAFVAQASDQAPRYGGALDVGWWPLDPVCCPTYLDFAGQVVGRHLYYWTGTATWRPATNAPGGVIPQARVAHAIAAGQPALADSDWWQVVTAYDQGDQPLIGSCPRGGTGAPERLGGPAWAFASAGEAMPALDRRQADIAALRHAVALGRDEVKLPGGYVTGQKAYALWAAALRDTEHLGEARWHSNMVYQLSTNRRSAVAYLEQMATRQPAPVAGHLLSAVVIYREVLERLSGADTGETAMRDPAGREALAQWVEGIAALETRAVAELQAAGAGA